MDVRSIVGTAIRSKVLSDPAVAALIVTRAYANQAPAKVPDPFITWEWMFGGWLERSPKEEFDIGFLITGIAKSSVQAELLSGYIDENFNRKDVVFPEGFICYAPVTQSNPFTQTTDVQTVPYWKIGATYRFRGIRE